MAQRQPQVPSSSATRNRTNMPTASAEASSAGGPTTSCTSVLLSTSVMRENVVALNSRGEKMICSKRRIRKDTAQGNEWIRFAFVGGSCGQAAKRGVGSQGRQARGHVQVEPQEEHIHHVKKKYIY